MALLMLSSAIYCQGAEEIIASFEVKEVELILE